MMVHSLQTANAEHCAASHDLRPSLESYRLRIGRLFGRPSTLSTEIAKTTNKYSSVCNEEILQIPDILGNAEPVDQDLIPWPGTALNRDQIMKCFHHYPTSRYSEFHPRCETLWSAGIGLIGTKVEESLTFIFHIRV